MSLSRLRTGIFQFQQFYPILSLQLWVLIFHPSWRACLLFVLAVALGAVWTLGSYARHRGLTLSSVQAFLQQFAGCPFTPLAPGFLHKYATASTPASPISPDADGPASAVITGALKAYVVGRGPRGIKRPRHISAFQFMTGGYLFLLDPPDEQSSYNRFTMQHELGHLTEKSTMLKGELIGVGLANLLLPWILLFSVQSWTTAAACAVFFAAQSMMRLRVDAPDAATARRLRGECLADLYAIGRVSPADLQIVVRSFERYGLPDDSLGRDGLASDFRSLLRLDSIRMRIDEGRVPDLGDIEPVFAERRSYILNVVSCAALAAIGQDIATWKLFVLLGVVAFVAVGAVGLIWNGGDVLQEIDAFLDGKAQKGGGDAVTE